MGNRGVKAISQAKWPKLTSLKLENIDSTPSSLSYLAKMPTKYAMTLTLGFEYISYKTKCSLPALEFKKIELVKDVEQ